MEAKPQGISNRLTAKQETGLFTQRNPKQTPLNPHLVASRSGFVGPAGHHLKDLCRQSSDGFGVLAGPRPPTSTNLLVVSLGTY